MYLLYWYKSTYFTRAKVSHAKVPLAQSGIQSTCFAGTKVSCLLALLVQSYLVSHTKAPTGEVRLTVEASLSLLALLVQNYKY